MKLARKQFCVALLCDRFEVSMQALQRDAPTTRDFADFRDRGHPATTKLPMNGVTLTRCIELRAPNPREGTWRSCRRIVKNHDSIVNERTRRRNATASQICPAALSGSSFVPFGCSKSNAAEVRSTRRRTDSTV
jgi:hypothetical protein